MQTVNISPHMLSVDHFNPRRFFDEKKLETLASSVKTSGILAPLIVRKKPLPEGVEPLDPAKQKFTVVCGSRRLEVAKRLELAEVPCVLREMDDKEAGLVAVTEQDSNDTLHFLERADHYQELKKAGATAEEIAEKTEQSVSAIHAIVAMHKLTPEAKRACFDNLLRETDARNLCTVPPELQGACLKKMLEPSLSGKPKTTDERKEVVAGFRLDLKDAPFDIEDDGLLPDVSRCGPCPYRSENRLELFGELKNPNLCTNPTCHARKAEAAWQHRVDEGMHNRGPKCLTGKEGEKLFDDRGQLRDDVPFINAHDVCHQDTAQRPYAALLGKAPQQYFHLARSPKGAVLELLPREGLTKLLDEAGKIRRAPAPKSAKPKEEPEDERSKEEKKKHAEKVRIKAEARVRIVAAIIEKVKKREPDRHFWRMLADFLFNQAVVPEEVYARRDIKEGPKAYLDRLKEADLRAFVFECIGGIDLYGQPGAEKHPDGLKLAAEYYSIEHEAIDREVKAESRVKPKTMKAEKEISA